MISCKSVSRLLASDQLEAQSAWTKFRVRCHLAICEFCKRFAKQMDDIRSAARRLAEDRQKEDRPKELEDRLIARLTKRP